MEIATVEQDVQVEMTGKKVEVFNTYINKLMFLYHCFHKTTLGPNILAVVLCNCCLPFISKLRVIDIYLHKTIPAMIIAWIAVTVCYRFDIVSAVAITYCTGANFALASVLLVINLFVWLTVGIPLQQFAWDLGLLFYVNTDENFSGLRNNFFKITRGQRIQYLNTDLSNYVLAACLETQTSIEIMLYNNFYLSKNIRQTTVVLPTAIWVVFAGAFSLNIKGDYPIGYEFFGILAGLVFLILMLIFLVVFHIVWPIFNLLLCCLPRIIAKKIKEHLAAAIIGNVGNETARRMTFS